MSNQNKKRGRGRPNFYGEKDRQLIVRLVEVYGLTGTQAVLQERSEGIGIKRVENWTKFATISLPTIGKIAKNAGVVLHRGRPKIA